MVENDSQIIPATTVDMNTCIQRHAKNRDAIQRGSGLHVTPGVTRRSAHVPLDRIVIADTFNQRAGDVDMNVRSFANRVDTIMWDLPGGPADFEREIQEALQNGQRVGVITNFHAGLGEQGALPTLLKIEAETGVGTRRIMVTCYSEKKVRQACEANAVPRKKICRVPYTIESSERDIHGLQRLFTGY